MGASFISAKVIQKNDYVYLCPDGTLGVNVGNNTVGQQQIVPTPATASVEGDYWAVPVGINYITGFHFVPTSAGDTNAPTPDSFHVVKVVDKESSDWWYLRGVSFSETPGNYGYTQATQDAESNAAVKRTMPTDIPLLAGRQDVCNISASGNYFVTMSVPTLLAGQNYKPYGWFNGVALPQGAANGFASTSALLAHLSSNWTNIGSPAVAITWTLSSDNITLIGTITSGGDGTQTFAGAVSAWYPSA